MTNKEVAYQKISELVVRFEEQIDSYKNANYNETLTRRDFIDPFFKALGWDIDNEQGYAEAYREVIHEDRVKIGKATKAPDYSFKLPGGKRLFFVEAKKPSVVVKDDILPAYQIRRYGWSAKLPVSIITDFEEFAIYDCTKKPFPTDKASVARIKYLTFRDYLKEFDFIWDTFSKEQVLKGSFDKYIQGNANKKGTTTVDKEFLLSLDSWRTHLATSISWNNKTLDEDEINFVVQQTIDRIIFLRIAEDRSIEPYGNLKSALSHGDYYQNLFTIFGEADAKYNSGIFDFKKDKLSHDVKIDNKVIKTIIKELYYPESPYEFSVLAVEILGSAYEQFLGKVIRITPGHHAKIEEKPEVRKAGGVYYTPQYVVEYIVKNTVGKLVEGKAPKDICDIKIVDPACGSGSFLIGAYQYLLDWHKDYYTSNGKLNASSSAIRRGVKGDVLTPEGHLTTSEKKRILLNNIYGVDIDVNAVEVTKLSLLLKCMEGETDATIDNQLRMFHERVLPTLDNNIKSGNSLVDTDFYASQLDFGEEKKIKPFKWEMAFPEVFNRKTEKPDDELKIIAQKAKQHASKALQYVSELEEKLNAVNEPAINISLIGGFDVVIGNPPYVAIEGIAQPERNYYSTKYPNLKKRLDLFGLFTDKGIKLLNENGKLGFIIPMQFLRNSAFELLRKNILNHNHIEEINYVGDKVFENVNNDTIILVIGKSKQKKQTVLSESTTTKTNLNIKKQTTVFQSSFLQNQEFIIDLSSSDSKKLFSKIEKQKLKINERFIVIQGIVSGLNGAFIYNDKEIPILERVLLKRFIFGSDFERYFMRDPQHQILYINKQIDIKQYPKTEEILKPFKKQLETRREVVKKVIPWYSLQWPREMSSFAKPKILFQKIRNQKLKQRLVGTYDENGLYLGDGVIYLNSKSNDKSELKFLLALLNSHLYNFYYREQFLDINLKIKYLSETSIIDYTAFGENSKLFNEIVNLVDQLLNLNIEKYDARLPSSVTQIEGKIDYCENRINEIVYQLYELTDDEIKIVEGK